VTAAVSTVFVRHDGEIRKAGTAPSLCHPAHSGNIYGDFTISTGRTYGMGVRFEQFADTGKRSKVGAYCDLVIHDKIIMLPNFYRTEELKSFVRNQIR
jgi:hypothetical protein